MNEAERLREIHMALIALKARAPTDGPTSASELLDRVKAIYELVVRLAEDRLGI